MDRFSKWPAASLCKYTDGETAVNFFEQYIQLNGIPKTIRTDKAIAFTGRLFRDFCKKTLYQIDIRHTVYPYPNWLSRKRSQNTQRKSLDKYKSRRTLRKSTRFSFGNNAENTTHETEKISLRTTIRPESKHGS